MDMSRPNIMWPTTGNPLIRSIVPQQQKMGPKELSQSAGQKGILRQHGSHKSARIWSKALAIKHENPWNIFEPYLDITLDSPITLCNTLTRPTRCVAIEEFSAPDVDFLPWLQSVQSMAHPHLVALEAVYRSENRYFVVWETSDVTIEHVLSSTSPLKEDEVRLMLFQVGHHLTPHGRFSVDCVQILRGIGHFTSCGFSHDDLKPSSFVLGEDGIVKLGTASRPYIFTELTFTKHVLGLFAR